MAVRERKLPRAPPLRRSAARRSAPRSCSIPPRRLLTRHLRRPTPPGVARDRLPDQRRESAYPRRELNSENTTTTAPGDGSLGALSFLPRARVLVWLVGRYYGRRSASSGPTVAAAADHRTHSHSCERERSVRRVPPTKRTRRRDGNAETRFDQRGSSVPDLRRASVSLKRDSATRINGPRRARPTLSTSSAQSSPFPCPWRSLGI
ncbi:hypothetical protein PUN28_011986 [Cardiocondyla obscurior]|uniref:Uncharacterized protein n=1 Tax=Cardiocondyla obscurior TaxID=286306 RepID=A0AAW2F8N1_9HYME